MRKDFIEAFQKHQTGFGLDSTVEKIELLAGFFELIKKHNEFLHLVAPVSAEEFAVRHILESLMMLEFLPPETKFADIGTGAGLPAIPCLLVREDLCAFLIESKLKKAKFLEEVSATFGLENRAQIFGRQFEEIEKPDVSFVTCRALDKFTKKLPKLLRWSKGCRILFFGGNNLGEELEKLNVQFEKKLIPESEKRFLFIARN